MRTDRAAAPCTDLTEVAHRRSWPARFNNEPDEFDNLALEAHRLEAVQTCRITAQIDFNCGIHIPLSLHMNVNRLPDGLPVPG